VKEVDFLRGRHAAGERDGAPYSISWTNVQPGNYTLTAVAIDNKEVALFQLPFR